MTDDPTRSVLKKIEGSFDRFQEAHWWIHSLEQWYHHADPFRWHLNAFLKALNETPKLLQMELQNHPGFNAWYKTQRLQLNGDPLLRFLSQQRNFVVHRGMLVPGSHGTIGVTEGRGMKLGLSIPINALEDSAVAMTRYLHAVANSSDFLGILTPDEDSMPCVQREWRLLPLEEDIVDLAARAWLTVGNVMTATVRWMGAEVSDLSLSCRHSSQAVQFKLFARKDLKKELQAIKKERGSDSKRQRGT